MERIIKYELSEQELKNIIRTAVADGIEEYEHRRAGEEDLTVAQAATIKQVSVTTIRRAIKAKELKAEPLTKTRYSIKRKDLWAYRPR